VVVYEQVADNENADNEKPVKQSTETATKVKYHTVTKGESLSKISEDYSVSMGDLIAWNSLESNNIIVGQKLRVNAPAGENDSKSVAQKTPSKENQTKPEGDLKLVFYTVKPGDSLWSISQKYDGVTIDQLKEWNKISGSAGLKVGQKIKLILPAG
jgi:membrane-bound lytic murein transglycosylase D